MTMYTNVVARLYYNYELNPPCEVNHYLPVCALVYLRQLIYTDLHQKLNPI